MRVGLIAPPWAPVPPVGYGGTEVVVDNLARGLQVLGHDVRLFTVGDSTCPVPTSSLYGTAPRPIGTTVEEAAHVLAAYEAMAEVDLIHDHTVLGPLLAPWPRHGIPPVVSTHHGAFTDENRRIVREVARRAAVIAISHDQASRAPEIPIASVIHHGIDLATYRPGPGDGGYLLFLGRMSREKGIAAALRVAHRTGRRLKVVTKMRDPSETDYFTTVVEPMLADDDELLLEPTIETRLDLLQHAEALINPIAWPEPFGLAMAEALASGTPVIGYGAGAAPEIVDHGSTGLLCHDEDDLSRAVGRIRFLDRGACRAAAERRFSLARMAHDHVELYERVLSNPASAHELHLGVRPQAEVVA
ncbi:glycosyltransferase family 4 protein [Nocardioides nematodiphilus]|uniref:glycosyltransferase family 4 protein n=1 Tax=Nocardioides nematodiphilus TaxID=2849669 RepID=UPI001CDA1D1A|nr:glycosyltransferase family 4 protein [Nocardioides nematodiphilus]MCA1983793.1 glycosyltransferase family 4 protein [Nocardioides nematodiphilus]